MHHREVASYKKDKKSLVPYFFQRVNELFHHDEDEEEKRAIKHLLDEQIVPKTIRQGESFLFIVNLVKEDLQVLLYSHFL